MTITITYVIVLSKINNPLVAAAELIISYY